MPTLQVEKDLKTAVDAVSAASDAFEALKQKTSSAFVAAQKEFDRLDAAFNAFRASTQQAAAAATQKLKDAQTR